MNLLILLLTFLIYLLIQALAINGIYIAAYGKTDILPDGTTADSEMILYPLYKFLNQSAPKKIGFTLVEIRKRTQAAFPIVAGAVIQWVGAGPLFPITPMPGQTLNLAALEAWADVYLKAKVEYDTFNKAVIIYQEEPVYRFSKYIRKPVITCVICMPSLWCIFLFLIPVIYFLGWHWQIIPIWIVNTFCVSYLTYVIFKPRK